VHGVHVSPSEIEKVILEHPGVADCAVVGVRGASQSDGFIPRAWLVLSEPAKAKGIHHALKAVEEFARGRLSERQWLQGGFEIVDEVTPCFITSANRLRYPPTQ
jgi:acyl-coenzyme A synthetase/AMP-(fatty) acid ligase